MKFNVKPLVGIDEVQFGMSLSEVRNIVKSSHKSFKRAPTSVHPCDYFELIGLFVYYDASSNVEALEFCEPAILEFEGMDLIASSFVQIVSVLNSKDVALEIEENSFTSYSLGIGGYAPDLDDDPNSICESVILFKDDYYDQEYDQNKQWQSQIKEIKQLSIKLSGLCPNVQAIFAFRENSQVGKDQEKIKETPIFI